MAVTWATQTRRGIFWNAAQEQRTFAYGSVMEAFPKAGVRDVGVNMFMRVPKNEEYVHESTTFYIKYLNADMSLETKIGLGNSATLA